jgi:hypothetical protein
MSSLLLNVVEGESVSGRLTRDSFDSVLDGLQRTPHTLCQLGWWVDSWCSVRPADQMWGLINGESGMHAMYCTFTGAWRSLGNFRPSTSRSHLLHLQNNLVCPVHVRARCGLHKGCKTSGIS